MEQNVWLETLNTAPEQNSQSTVIKHHLNQVKTYQLDMLLKHPGYDGDGCGGVKLDWISMLCAIPPASIWWRGFAIQGNKVNNIPAGKLTDIFLMTYREEENSGFHVQETHVRDKKKSKWTATMSALRMMSQWMFEIITTPSPGNMYLHQSQAALSGAKRYYRPTVNQLLPSA